MDHDFRPRPPRWPRWLGAIAVVAALIAGGALILGGYADRNGREFFPATGPTQPIGALYISGDMGLRFDVGRSMTDELTDHGIATSAIASPSFFKQRRTRAEVDAVIAQAVRDTIAQTGRSRVVAIGRSYGADVLQTGLADLPADLRPHIARVILIVPGDKVFFRSDPSTVTYHGTPDSIGADTVNRIDWTPITCIYGAAETDSL
ncbi:MAG: hypothetical protein OSB00_17215, partial [Sphingomonas bacterium]|nr:hypothetical protein [Sphingomonas bacterium]